LFVVSARGAGNFSTRNALHSTIALRNFSPSRARKNIDDIFLRLYSASLKGGIDAMAKKKAATKKTTKKSTTKKKSR
jgi:hypothetical protein